MRDTSFVLKYIESKEAGMNPGIKGMVNSYRNLVASLVPHTFTTCDSLRTDALDLFVSMSTLPECGIPRVTSYTLSLTLHLHLRHVHLLIFSSSHIISVSYTL